MNTQQILLVRDGHEEQVERIYQFVIKEFNKEYILFTKNERDSEGNILVYFATLVKDGENYTAQNIATEEEWNVIKDFIRQLAKKEVTQ